MDVGRPWIGGSGDWKKKQVLLSCKLRDFCLVGDLLSNLQQHFCLREQAWRWDIRQIGLLFPVTKDQTPP